MVEQQFMASPQTGKGRIVAIDAARAVALVAMAVYHFTWDLEYFGYVESGTAGFGAWKVFARSIATSFLVLAGISLVLGHGRGLRWRPWLDRLLRVSAAAALITVATWYAMPDTYIFFGILHQIALASVIGLAFLRLPWVVTAVAAAAIVALPAVFRDPLFASPWLWWVGLAPLPPMSNDYVPVFPWTGAVLAGMALAQLGRSRGWFEALRNSRLNARTPAWLAWPGRHSLAVYLVHQPVLIAMVWTWAQLFPPAVTVGDARPGCEAQCMTTNDEEFCRAWCLCVLDELDQRGMLGPVLRGNRSAGANDAVAAARALCESPQDTTGDQSQ
ncbi:hypothetical protein CSC94_21210 [Zhengella mangrovi]|uniref:Heparan-alpha-glucosaminide N-acetyltransferase catalytic domain-containing protein n=2 Tax=Zhengella mangrovi TaxID=1982044 RepID=A0A2G1QHV9_9HYPH|nr:hypothetical protein CSC94_21210 [Zhengella mangrovi]